jgi:hypothetical protein
MERAQQFKTWPARYKAWHIDVYESDRYQNWLTVSDVRRVVPSLRKDAVLHKEYLTGVEQLDKSKRLFFNEQALTAELKRNRGQDALMFLAWFEKTVVYPAKRKREGIPALHAAVAKTSYDERGLAVPPVVDVHQHIPARSPRESLKFKQDVKSRSRPIESKPLNLRQRMWRPILLIWRGQMDLKETFFAGGLLAVMFGLAIDWFIGSVGSADNYQGDFLLREWLIVMAILVSTLGPIWWCVGLMRCALRYQREHRSGIRAFLAFIGGASIMLNSTAATLSTSGEWLQGWFDDITNKNSVVEVTHDPILGRLVLRGEIGFGSFKALQKALAIKPKLNLIEVESPGGYVIEGMAMAKLIQANGLDTVSMEKCASACTLLLAAGQERYLGPSARIGFHRSGVFGLAPSSGWTATEYRIADYYRARGASQDFIKLALDTPFNRIWVPDHGAMFEAGYASKMWSERKSGY